MDPIGRTASITTHAAATRREPHSGSDRLAQLSESLALLDALASEFEDYGATDAADRLRPDREKLVAAARAYGEAKTVENSLRALAACKRMIDKIRDLQAEPSFEHGLHAARIESLRRAFGALMAVTLMIAYLVAMGWTAHHQGLDALAGIFAGGALLGVAAGTGAAVRYQGTIRRHVAMLGTEPGARKIDSRLVTAPARDEEALHAAYRKLAGYKADDPAHPAECLFELASKNRNTPLGHAALAAYFLLTGGRDPGILRAIDHSADTAARSGAMGNELLMECVRGQSATDALDHTVKQAQMSAMIRWHSEHATKRKTHFAQLALAIGALASDRKENPIEQILSRYRLVCRDVANRRAGDRRAAGAEEVGDMPRSDTFGVWTARYGPEIKDIVHSFAREVLQVPEAELAAAAAGPTGPA